MKNINKDMVIILLIGLLLLCGCSYYMCVVLAIDMYKVHFVYQGIVIPLFFLISCYLYSKKYKNGHVLFVSLLILEFINILVFYNDNALFYLIFTCLLGFLGMYVGNSRNNG